MEYPMRKLKWRRLSSIKDVWMFSFGERHFAALIDNIVVIVLWLITHYTILVPYHSESFNRINSHTFNTFHVFFIIHALYFILIPTIAQTTIGKRCYSLYVTQMNGKRVNIFAMIIKYPFSVIHYLIDFATHRLFY